MKDDELSIQQISAWLFIFYHCQHLLYLDPWTNSRYRVGGDSEVWNQAWKLMAVRGWILTMSLTSWTLLLLFALLYVKNQNFRAFSCSPEDKPFTKCYTKVISSGNKNNIEPDNLERGPLRYHLSHGRHCVWSAEVYIVKSVFLHSGNNSFLTYWWISFTKAHQCTCWLV